MHSRWRSSRKCADILGADRIASGDDRRCRSLPLVQECPPGVGSTPSRSSRRGWITPRSDNRVERPARVVALHARVRVPEHHRVAVDAVLRTQHRRLRGADLRRLQLVGEHRHQAVCRGRRDQLVVGVQQRADTAARIAARFSMFTVCTPLGGPTPASYWRPLGWRREFGASHSHRSEDWIEARPSPVGGCF